MTWLTVEDRVLNMGTVRELRAVKNDGVNSGYSVRAYYGPSTSDVRVMFSPYATAAEAEAARDAFVAGRPVPAPEGV